MSKSIPSHATPAMLEWTRRQSGFSRQTVEELDSIPVADLESWEKGVGMPSLAQLQKLAARYKYPLMVFYLESPPKNFSVGKIKDFRTIASRELVDFSPELKIAIRSAQERQAWASAYLCDEGFPEVACVGSLSEATDPAEAARQLREMLGFSLHEQIQCTRDSESFLKWKRHCESLGIFVFSTPKVEIDEMRGFALPDRFAPTVVINSHDSYTAKTFTVIHEVVHILLDQSGVSGSPEVEVSPFSRTRIEKFCNRVAAETLVPLDDFKSHVPRDWESRDDFVIQSLARRYWVSRAMIVFRLLESGLADKNYYHSKYAGLATPQKEGGIAEQHVIALSRNGEAFARLALSAFHSGEIHGGQLASLLGMRLQHLPSLESHLSPMRVQRMANSEAP